MIKLEKFTGDKTYMYPNGEIAPPERVMSDFPATRYFTHVIEVSGNVCGAVQELGALRQLYDIDETLTEDEAIQTIQNIKNTPVIVEPSAEERIASAMEFQNLMSL